MSEFVDWLIMVMMMTQKTMIIVHWGRAYLNVQLMTISAVVKM